MIVMVEYQVTRKVLRIGARDTGSLAIALPKLWARTHGLVAGAEVTVVFGDSEFLKVLPYKNIMKLS